MPNGLYIKYKDIFNIMEIQKLKKEFLAVMLIGLVVAVSGCTIPIGQGEEPKTSMAGTQGLRITYFGPDVQYPVSGQSITLEATVKNVGGSTAENIQGKLYLLGWADTSTQTGGSLRAPDEEIGREGEETTLRWTQSAPNVTSTQTYDAGVHIQYDYTTNTVATVYAFSREEYRKRMERGESIPKVQNVVNSDAPVHVDVRVQNILRTGSTDVPITLMFNNVGGGNLEYNNSKKQYIIRKATVEVGNTTKTCPGITMRGGSTGSCTIKVDIPGGRDEVKLPIEITTEYTYEVSQETKITVHPEFE